MHGGTAMHGTLLEESRGKMNQGESFKHLPEKVVPSHAWNYTISRAVGNRIAGNSEILVSALSCQGMFFSISLWHLRLFVFSLIKIRLRCT